MPIMPIRFSDDLSNEIDKIVEHYSATTKNGAINQALSKHLALVEQVRKLDNEVYYLRSKLSDIAEAYNASDSATKRLQELLE